MGTSAAELDETPVFKTCGHPKTEENSQWNGTYDVCRTCRRDASKRYKLRLKELGTGNNLKGTQEQRDAIVATANEHYLSPSHPVTVRHVYYKLRTHDGARFRAGIGFPDNDDLTPEEKKEEQQKFYIIVASALAQGRLSGKVEWDSIIDVTRGVDYNRGYTSKKAFLKAMASCWSDDMLHIERSAHIECWVEKDAILSDLDGFCRSHQITLRSLKGQTSLSAAYQAAKDFRDIEKPIKIFYFGDLDAHGKDIEEKAREKLGYLEKVFDVTRDVELIRLGLTPEDVVRFDIDDDPEVDVLEQEDYEERLESALEDYL
jgi:hypothetical protein